MGDISQSGAAAAIAELKQAYCDLVDAKDWPGFAALFTDDAPMHPSQSAIASGKASSQPPVGGKAIAEWVSVSIADAQTRHEVWPVSLDISGDTARGVWRMRDRVIWPARDFSGTGHYIESYRLTPDGWRIAETRLDREGV